MILAAGTVLLFFLTLLPYHLYTSGQLHYFLYAFHQLQPEILSRDWLVTQTANPHPFFAHGIALLSSLGNLPFALFAVHAAQFLFLVIGIFSLTRIFSKDLRTPIVVFCLLLFYFSDGIGQSTLYSSIVQPEDLAKLFYLFSLTALFEEKITRTWIFLGLTALFDVLSGLEGLLLFVVFWLFRGRNWDRKQMAVGFLLFLAISAPNLIPILRNFSPLEPLGSGEVQKILFNFRGPHHYRIFTFEVAHIFRTLFPAVFFLLNAKSLIQNRQGSQARFYVITLLSFCALAVVSIEIFYSPRITSLRLFRLSPFLLLLGLVFLSRALLQELDRKEGLGILLTGMTLAILFLEKDSRLFVPLSVFLLAVWSFRRQISWKSLSLFQKIIFAAFLVSVPTSLYLARGKIAELILDFSLGAGFTAFLVIGPKWKRVQSFLPVVLMGGPALCFHIFFPERVSFHPIEIEPPPPMVQRAPKFYEALQWIRMHTPPDALLLTPPYEGGVRFFSKRSIIVDFHANPYETKEVKEWKARLETVTQTHDLEKWIPKTGNTLPQLEFLRKAYLSLSASQVEEIAGHYGADYFLMESSYAGKGPLVERGHRLVFENSSYLLFEIEPV